MDAIDPEATAVAAPVALGGGELGLGPGTSVGRYIVLAELGAGAMGVVVMAYDPELDRRVAVKLLKPALRRAGVLLKREAQALAKLAHPNVVAVYDVGEHLDRVFVTMEYVEGEVLSRWLAREPRPSWSEILAVYLAAGRGLAAAHERGLIHRDFKPDNVMLGDDGRVRVMDFGLARTGDPGAPAEPRPSPPDRQASSPSLHPHQSLQARHSQYSRASSSSLTNLRLTQTGAMTGTPAYMAPEQYRGEPTAFSDQFGFCVSLYEALYGAHPFLRGQSVKDLVASVERGEVTPLTGSVAAPSWLREVLLRGMAARPQDRFNSRGGSRSTPRTGWPGASTPAPCMSRAGNRRNCMTCARAASSGAATSCARRSACSSRPTRRPSIRRRRCSTSSRPSPTAPTQRRC